MEKIKYTRQHKLINKRKDLGLTQADVAMFLGISANAYSLKEIGKSPFFHTEMFMLKKLFGAENLEDIFLNPN